MPQTKIQGKFYPLQHEEFIKLNKRLTQSELAVYLWLKTNDPFGDKLVEASSKQIADDLNVSRRTIQRALVKLRDQNLIDLIITKFQYRVKSNPPKDTSEPEIKETLRVATPGSPSDTSVAIGTRMSPSVRECRHRYENVAIGTGMSPPQPETESEQELENPKTLKTYSDFKKTLSEGERENFFNFVKEEAKNLERKINDLEAWLASKNAAKQNRWEIYYKNYQEQEKRESAKANKQNQGSEKLSPAQMQRAIAEFQKRMGINQPVDEPESEEINSEELQRRNEELNKLIDNPPERSDRKSLAQQRREAIAKAKQQQHELDLERKRKNAERQRQQELDEPDPEKRKAKIIRETEEFLRNRQQQNSEIGEENLENE